MNNANLESLFQKIDTNQKVELDDLEKAVESVFKGKGFYSLIIDKNTGDFTAHSLCLDGTSRFSLIGMLQAVLYAMLKDLPLESCKKGPTDAIIGG